MLQGEALEIVLDMAHGCLAEKYHRGEDKAEHEASRRGKKERQAIEEVEQLLSQFEDTGNYTEDDYMED